MRLAFVGDTHGRVLHALAGVLAAQREVGAQFDWVLQVGDFGAFPVAEQLGWIGVDAHEESAREFLTVLDTPAPDRRLRRIRAQLGRPVVFVRGNHDNAAWLAGLGPDRSLCPADPHDLFRYAPDGLVLDLGPLTVAFLGGVEDPDPSATAWPGTELLDEAAYQRLWALGPGQIDILITHEAPAGPPDLPGGRTGSPRLAALARRLRPRLHIGGHLHVPVGPVRLGPTTYLGLASVLRSPRADPSRALRPGCLAVLDTDDGVVRHLDQPWLRDIHAGTLASWLP